MESSVFDPGVRVGEEVEHSSVERKTSPSLTGVFSGDWGSRSIWGEGGWSGDTQAGEVGEPRLWLSNDDNIDQTIQLCPEPSLCKACGCPLA